MYMTAIKEVNRHIIYIIIRHCYFVEYVELTTQGVNIIFSGKLTRRVVKIWAPEMISTYHNLGAQPCKLTTGNWQALPKNLNVSIYRSIFKKICF